MGNIWQKPQPRNVILWSELRLNVILEIQEHKEVYRISISIKRGQGGAGERRREDGGVKVEGKSMMEALDLFWYKILSLHLTQLCAN